MTSQLPILTLYALFQVITELSLASMELVVMEYMMTQQGERKERTAQIPNPRQVGGPGGKHAPAPTVKTVKEGELTQPVS